ncbi:unnamed protein product [Symbiodinium natans]|uniref:Uncharacterized protein n=1 Tax=Symbiodinium natans TaxID=878477 RepID=A0A812RK83_9DINO|nr:unnamed protein product [Symbiodinium natans]
MKGICLASEALALAVRRAGAAEGALLFFEMKARARKVDHAVLQLRKRQELLRFRPATPCQVQLFAILALVPSDDQGYQLLRDAAWKHGDVEIATVDPDCLPKHAVNAKPDLDWAGDDTVQALKWDDLDWEGDDTVEALKWDVRGLPYDEL